MIYIILMILYLCNNLFLKEFSYSEFRIQLDLYNINDIIFMIILILIIYFEKNSDDKLYNQRGLKV